MTNQERGDILLAVERFLRSPTQHTSTLGGTAILRTGRSMCEWTADRVDAMRRAVVLARSEATNEDADVATLREQRDEARRVAAAMKESLDGVADFRHDTQTRWCVRICSSGVARDIVSSGDGGALSAWLDMPRLR